MTVSSTSIDQLSINTIRTLSMDAVQQANSGHPGTPMALAPVAYGVWQQALRFDPAHPNWVARDRFVLSCGHASMLLYSLLHLTGVQAVDENGQPLDRPAISLDDIRNFRQMESPCAGHPEFGEAAGIETTTGPLGQGIANSVGMAIASKFYESRYNRPDFDMFGFDVYSICSDGDLMEGVGREAASIAGHLGLGNLCWIYDDNKITIEGSTDLAYTEDVDKLFESMGWNVARVDDANDIEAIQAALDLFRMTDDRPTIIILKSIIGYGAPNKQDSAAAHGAPLGDEEIRLAKRFYGWDEEQKFHVPEDVMTHFAEGIGARGQQLYEKWQGQWQAYQEQFPSEAAELTAVWSGKLPEGWDRDIPEFSSEDKPLATRSSSGKVLNAIAKNLPWMMGGSADLAGSNKSQIDGEASFEANHYAGRNMHFGVREHAMAAICNGMSLSGIRSYAATFFVFTDYMRPSMRLSSLMHQGVIYLLTHDSIGLGEDGPTHQPVEHLAACRAIPGLNVLRPADANEVAWCYRVALQQDKNPSAMVLSRQNLPTIDRNGRGPAAGTARGGYTVVDCAAEPQVILIGTGSELMLCIEAAEKLTDEGIAVRVVSMPCFELFDQQDADYRNSILPANVHARVGVEAGIRMGWDRYLGTDGHFVGMDSFGASAPAEELYEHFGITVENIVKSAKAQLA
ncbi:MAG: transketolase [Planctomycetaceae bacterium]|nr:transketolase [Planctomycetaceae bacterium]MCP4462280.1 transketolase [Planctomycetaceae bacterium]